MAEGGNIFEQLGSALGDIFSAKDEVVSQVEEVQQSIQDANPLNALDGEAGNNDNENQGQQ